MVLDEKKNHRIPEIFAVFRCIQCYSSVKTNIYTRNMLFIRNYYRGGTGEPRFFLGAAVSHLEGTETSQRAAVWESTGPPPCSRGGIWLYPDEHNQF